MPCDSMQVSGCGKSLGVYVFRLVTLCLVIACKSLGVYVFRLVTLCLVLACYAVCLLCRPLSGESESSYSDSEAEMEVTDVRILYVIIISTVYLYQVSVSHGCIHNDFFKVCAYCSAYIFTMSCISSVLSVAKCHCHIVQ